jgi:hypothetical protein
VDPEHLVCGLAASLHDWEPRQFAAWLRWAGDGGPLPPLLLDHEPALVTPRGAGPASAGTCLAFASVPPAGIFPGGLVVLAALHPDLAPSVLASMRRGQWLAMSVRGGEDHFRGERGDLFVTEVSLVSRVGAQADPGALVIDYGRDAALAWELLTGHRWG